MYEIQFRLREQHGELDYAQREGLQQNMLDAIEYVTEDVELLAARTCGLDSEQAAVYACIHRNLATVVDLLRQSIDHWYDEGYADDVEGGDGND